MSCPARPDDARPGQPARGSMWMALLLCSALPVPGCGLSGCVNGRPEKTAPTTGVATGTATAKPAAADEDRSVDIAHARKLGRKRLFEWATWSKETFERARRENRFILLDGAAEWCHWCHVMDETTYTDPEVGQILRDRFVAIRVDIDSRPDIAERYGAWGWPATVLYTAGAEEIGKFRGYLAPERMRGILREVIGGSKSAGGTITQPLAPAGKVRPVPAAALPWIGLRAARDQDAYWDPEEKGWGRRQKASIGVALELDVLRYKHGDRTAGTRVLETLRKQRALIDPVWGGIYQYSEAGSWLKPHYEKLMTFQAAGLEAFARVYAAMKDPGALGDARLIERYLREILSNKDGAFLVTQDADVGAHDKKGRFVEGKVFYAADDAGRRALGMPRIDENVYARENGLGIAAFAVLHEATGDPKVLERARKAADLMLRTHVGPDGTVRHDAKDAEGPFFLPDAAALGRGLALLAAATGQATYREAALRVAAAMLKNFDDPETGALWAHTPDPSAAGVFTRREKPFGHNLTAVRFLTAVARVAPPAEAAALRQRATRILSAIAQPDEMDNQGRFIGELCLALDELGLFPW